MIHVVLSNWGKVEPGGQSGEQWKFWHPNLFLLDSRIH